ncbi:MAG: hypothetical protein PHC28_13265 [Flavobacterium sp.]|uniref:hypothetical protein n=1 Tax=Flavobacterium sp. TaxID=239 RepID=UPI0026038415|nr:hypothetical protein [Flavobacterium sp.]MDD5151421.1 hypothetical protein [Flavobacterium sp.]
MGYNYNKGNYGNNNNRGYNNNAQHQKKVVKHSGAKTTKYFPTTGPNKGIEQHLTTGWKLANRELIAIKCVTTQKSKLSDKGWLGSVACTLTNTKTGIQAFHWGTMEAKTGKVVIDALAMVVNPKAKNGGYAGTFINK